MRNYTKTITALLLTVCIAFSLCACEPEKDNGSKALCEAFCEDVKSGDTAKLMTYLQGTDVTEEALKEIIEPSDLNSAQLYYLKAINSTISYTVQDPVVDKQTKTATVYLSWREADYSQEPVRNAATIADFDSAMAKVEDKTITIPVTVDLSGEAPKILDAKKVIDAVYAYTSDDNRIMPGKLSDFYVDGSLVLAPNGEYTNTKEIGIRVNFKEDVFKYRFVPGIVYSVKRDNDILYESKALGLDNGTVRLDFNSEVTEPTSFNADGFLLPGDYTFTVYDDSENEIAEFKCKVNAVELKQETFVFKKFKNDYYLSHQVNAIKDNSLKEISFADKSGWWDYDGTSVGKSAFASNTKTLGFSLAVNPDSETELFYDYYYCKDADFKNVNNSKPVFSSSCKPTIYDDQACYDIDYKADKFNPGFYGVVVYSDSSKKHIVLTAACMVVKEKSQDVLGKKK